MKKLSDQDKIDIVNKYQTRKYTCTQIGKEYGTSGDNIAKLLKRRGIDVSNLYRRKYTLNEYYFDVIDTEHKAYWLGLLYADGCNFRKNNVITIELQEKDKEILEKFNYDIESNRPIMIKNKKTESSQNTLSIRFNSKHLSIRLFELGCINCKSLTLRFPTPEQVPEHLLRHWLRGMWDGDGNYNLLKRTTSATASICGTIFVCEKIQKYIKDILDIHMSLYIEERLNNGITSILKIGGNKQYCKFINFLYKDATIYLDRKYQKALMIEEVLFNFNQNYSRTLSNIIGKTV